jgi:2-succinyl-5-enolpyruvyl-6-hydroxy-3-cyclohexene-1-carboxylate synthase
MPVRDLDAFMPARSDELRVLCNRGANGIDGVLSSALGAAVAGAGPVVLLIGDIALLHDIGALLTARRHRIDLTIVLLNNDGGAIFSYLPIADGREREAFDDYFRLPHGLSFAAAADFYGLDYERIGSAEALRRALQRCSAGGGTHLLELPIDPAGNLRHFRELIAEAAELGAAQAGAT